MLACVRLLSSSGILFFEILANCVGEVKQIEEKKDVENIISEKSTKKEKV
jgi:hypothetical protein